MAALTRQNAGRECIVNYFKLCWIAENPRSHVVDSIPEDVLSKFITKKEMEIFFKKRNDHFVPREVVVGGAKCRIIVL